MYRIALFALLACLAGTSLLLGHSGNRSPAQDLVIRPGEVPPLSARSVKVEPGLLLVSDLEDVPLGTTRRNLGGRVLVYCPDGWVQLGLWAISISGKMMKATPILGHEAPEQSFSFTAPVPLTLVFLDKNGAVRRTQGIKVKEVREICPRHLRAE